MTPVLKGLLLIVWIAAIAVLGWVVNRNLVVGSDLRLFMPSPRTQQERLILEEIGEGPASRMLLLAISGGTPEAAADTSRALAAALRDSDEFRLVANGESNLDAIPESMLPYRYLLSPTLDDTRLDTSFLIAQLQERVRDLGSPAATFLKPWLPRDPTLELLKLAESWMPEHQPQMVYDVWFDSYGKEALLVAETRAAGFDPQGQREAADELQQAFETSRTDEGLRLEASGPGAFSVLMQQRTRDEVEWIGTIDVIGIVILLLVAYRSVPILVLGLLPLATAGVAGLAAVGTIFGQVHGITLAFGFTLIGVAQDYPIHLFSHQHRGLDARASVRALWPTLATGVASTCVAYLAFLFSGVGGLAQLSVFTVTGLAVAGLTTRFLLPWLVPDSRRDAADSALLGQLWHSIAGLPRPLWLGIAATAACVAYLALSPRPLWQDSLGGLTPVPQALVDRDVSLRRELGAPDMRHLLVIEGEDAQSVLEKAVALEPALQSMVERGQLDGFDDPARYLPPRSLQEHRRAALPAPEELRLALSDAMVGTPFKPGVFEPFLADVERARQLAALEPRDLAGTPLESRVSSLLLQRDGHWTGLVTLTRLNDPAALQQMAADTPGVTLLDLQQASEDLVAHQRDRILWCLAISAVLLIVVVFVALRDAARVRRVLAPMALTTLILVALFHAAGVSLSLFHLIALVLAAGLGLDYALFFEHAADDPAEQRRTLHAVIVCSLSTFLVFALLGLSTMPVLRAIGLTVAAGVVLNFVLALLLTRPRGPATNGR
ncbi:MAG: MMPL family transporter [Steroidobacteraceae bacterium]|nr:MMPL family transporter [Steroidobacteraceae bacterium]